MRQGRLNGLSMMHIHYSRILNYDAVIQLFAARNPRKIVFPDLGGNDSTTAAPCVGEQPSAFDD